MRSTDQKKTSSRRKELPQITLNWRGRTRTCILRPWLLGSLLTVFVVFMACYFSATIYLVYRDDILDSALARQIELQYAYEERIDLLRSEIDRVTSRHLVETQSLEEQVDILLEQQDALTRRQALLDSLIAKARAEGISSAAAAMPVPVPRPSRDRRAAAAGAAGEPLAYAPRRARRIEAITGTVMQPGEAAPADVPADGDAVRPVLRQLRSSLEEAQERQERALDLLGSATRQEVDRLSAMMGRLGVRPPHAPEMPQASAAAAGLGGPFIPAQSGFVDDALSVSGELLHLARIRQAAAMLPLGSPVEGSAVTSGFGYRNDPFLKRPAMHAGIDLRAKQGTPVRATAPGKVVSAGWNGGYGRLVEIEHAHGLTTRFAHLSKVNVQKGQQVRAGAVIGAAGSTGRSTGPHLHYETRRKNRAVDPMPFLEAEGRR